MPAQISINVRDDAVQTLHQKYNGNTSSSNLSNR